ncbi:ABC-2 type transport system permease protein [Streptomyces sp. 2112.3]|uniref:ABC transporter permease n=1 Tax=Streptomyces sp. 2112.3 TaxID=1881023 RepID=UPI000897C9C4|nr:ABC transporter permease [Streptomyces sp. 2112.3]SEE75894.1 ABC-2 type transport system permease protein [Streptomyces sp. 2112.3]
MPATSTTSAPAHPPAPPKTRAAASRAVLKTEARLFLRDPGSLFWILVFPTLLLTILGLIPSFREANPSLGGRRTIDLYVPVALLLAAITTGIQVMPAVLTGYRERGILRRMSTTPVRPVALLGAQIALHGGATVVSMALALTVGRLAFGVALPGQLAGYVLAAVLTLCSALALGCLLCALSPTTKAASVAGSAVFFPMMFAAGVWAPVQSMSDTLQQIVQLLPFGAASQALAQASSGHWPTWSHLAVLAVWTLVVGTVARHRFRWE